MNTLKPSLGFNGSLFGTIDWESKSYIELRSASVHWKHYDDENVVWILMAIYSLARVVRIGSCHIKVDFATGQYSKVG